MKILGIDPGYAIVGYGIIEYNGSAFKTLEYGAITTTPDMEFSKRIKKIYDGLNYIIEIHKPDSVAVEKLFFSDNKKTAIDVAQARGVILLSAENANIHLAEYTPIQIKQSVTGYGRADKKQMMDMTKRLLNLREMPKLDDTSDALAIAIAHAHVCSSRIR